MNYPEELRERYNEVMYDERDIIEKFLKDQYDLRYGHQRDTWHFEPAVKMMNIYGNEIVVTDIRLDKDRFVVFDGMFGNLKDEYECYHFAYGELSKVIEVLPDADDIIRKNATLGIKKQFENICIDYLLKEYPFEVTCNDGRKMKVGWMGRTIDGMILVGETRKGNTPLSHLKATSIADLWYYIHRWHLHGSDEYKKLRGLLANFDNLAFNFVEHGQAGSVSIEVGGVLYDVLDVSMDDTGNLLIYASEIEVEDEYVNLYEKDIEPSDLKGIIETIEHCQRYDIMDTYNSHNPELVRKINAAWKSDKYHNKFSEILLALLVRDHEEYIDKYCEIEDYSGDWAMAHAHEIMEGVCDDWDLETILSFIRYEENNNLKH